MEESFLYLGKKYTVTEILRNDNYSLFVQELLR